MDPLTAPAPHPRLRAWLYAWVLVLAVMAAYQDSLQGPFVYDDLPSIVANPSIRSFATAWKPISGAATNGITVAGRPVVALTLAANYAWGGLGVTGYHVVNLTIHTLAALILFGCLRRALTGTPDPGWTDFLAFAVALIWALHPLQTESVTYIVQRTEALMGLFYLLTLYGFIRGAQNGPGRRVWFALSVASCWLGMGTKEVMVSAPLIVLLYAGLFVDGGIAASLRRRPGYFAALASSWLLLAALVWGERHRGASAGFLTWPNTLAYWAAQPGTLLRYLRLGVWGHPLVFNYGFERFWSEHLLVTAGGTGVVAAMSVGVLLALRRAPRIAFLGLWFLAILAPTGLIPIARQTAAEHRMYLALAPLLAGLLLGAARLTRGWHRGWMIGVCTVLALAAGLATFARNRLYQTAIGLWADTVAHAPENQWARHNYGVLLLGEGRNPEAASQLSEAVRIDPTYPEAQNALGNALAGLGQPKEAARHYQAAIALAPAYREAHNGLGIALAQSGELKAARAEFEESVRLSPDYAEAHNNLGLSFSQGGDLVSAKRQFLEALRLKADYAEAHNNLGMVLLRAGQTEPAIGEFRAAIGSRDRYATAYYNLGLAYVHQGRESEAKGDNPGAREAYGQATAQFRRALWYAPSLAAAKSALQRVLERVGTK